MEKIRVYYIAQSSSSIDLMHKYIEDIPHLYLQESTQSFETAKAEISSLFPDIVIIDESVKGGGGDLPNKIQNLLLSSPFLGIIVISNEMSTQKIRMVMNAGARDVIIKPFTAAQLGKSVSAIHSYNQELKNEIIKKSSKILTRSPKMITVFSTKGGVGKSVISSLLATGLSYKFKEDAALVDLDLQFGDISLLLDLKPKSTITNAIESVEEMSDFNIRSFLTRHHLGMNILAAPNNPEEEEFITESSLTQIFKKLREEYDYTVIDTPPGFTEQSILALEQSDLIFFVTSPEISSLKNTKNGLETLKELEIDAKKIKLIVNRSNNKSNISTQMIEELLGVDVYLSITEDYERVIQFLNQGQPEIIYGNKSKIMKDYNSLINGIRSYHKVELKDKTNNRLKRLIWALFRLWRS